LTVIATVTDPDGRRVELTDERWAHIVDPDNHPELTDLKAEVLRAVASPDGRAAGREPDELWFYLANVGPSSWLKVVVRFNAERAFIVTAFPRRDMP
jgi:hypothetical protein